MNEIYHLLSGWLMELDGTVYTLGHEMGLSCVGKNVVFIKVLMHTNHSCFYSFTGIFFDGSGGVENREICVPSGQ